MKRILLQIHPKSPTIWITYIKVSLCLFFLMLYVDIFQIRIHTNYTTLHYLSFFLVSVVKDYQYQMKQSYGRHGNMYTNTSSGGSKGGGGNRRVPPPQIGSTMFFFIRMLKNKAQIARESIKITLELPGPFSGPWTPAESEFGSALVMCVLAYNILRAPAP